MLVDANATIDVRDNVTGKTALIKAAYVGHADVAEVLLKSGADRNAMVRAALSQSATVGTRPEGLGLVLPPLSAGRAR